MKIANKTVTATRLVKDAIAKAKHFSDHNIFTFINEVEALKRAAEIDAKISAGQPVGRLAGVPYALKDNFQSKSGNTTASSKMLESLHSPITTTAVKLLEDEGAIMIGRTNLDSFAHGSSTENSYFGATKNAVDSARVAGGSSGGSAVATALDIVEFATGTDTGGSIRQPASFNGVYGFKPTYGAISRYGVVAMASSTDCVGFFTKTPEDMDLLMQITARQDYYDPTTLPDFYQSRFSSHDPTSSVDSASSIEKSIPSTSSPIHNAEASSSTLDLDAPSAPARIGIIKDFDNDSVAPELRRALSDTISALEAKGHQIVSLDMPSLKHALAVYYIIVPAEVASNLSRHDGIRYGYRADQVSTLMSKSAQDSTLTSASDSSASATQDSASDDPLSALYKNSRNLGFMPENKRRIMIGNFVLSSGFYDAYYRKAQKARTIIIREYAKAFEQCDYILTPVSPSPAFKLGEKIDDPIAMYLEDIMSTSVNLAGLPSLAFPAGQTADHLPLGLQLVGARRSDAKILKFAHDNFYASNLSSTNRADQTGQDNQDYPANQSNNQDHRTSQEDSRE